MSEETAHEVWTNAPEGFDPRDRNALHARFPEGFVVVQVQQGRTPSTVDNPPEGYQDFVGVTFHGVELQATVQFAAELEDVEGIATEVGRVPSGSFEVIIKAHQDLAEVDGRGLPTGRWRFELWREGGEVVYHAFADDEGPHVCAGCIGGGLCELDGGRLGVSPPDCPSCGATPEEPHTSTCAESEEDGTEDERFASLPCVGCGAAGNEDCDALCTERAPAFIHDEGGEHPEEEDEDAAQRQIAADRIEARAFADLERGAATEPQDAEGRVLEARAFEKLFGEEDEAG